METLRIATGESVVALTKTDSEWDLVEPLTARADFTTVEGLVGRVGNGEILTIVAETAETEETDDGEADPFGFETPSATVTLGAGSTTATLLLGGPAPTGGRHARDASRSVVFTIDEALAEDLTQDASGLRRKDLFAFRSFNAQRLGIEQDGVTILFEKEEGEEEETWVQTLPDRLEVERGEMDDLLSKISNLRAESFVESREDHGLTDATRFATIDVTYEDGDTETQERVVLWRSDEDTFAVAGDEPGAAIVDTRSVDDAYESLQTIRQADGDES